MIVKNSSLSVDTEKLRKKILDLVMRGKLVPQDSQDEPASVLLEKIKAEKAQLIKEKKIKKSKPLPEITAEEKPFEIPESWEWVRLGEVANILSGRDLPKRKHLVIQKENSIPYITGASNINNGIISYETWTDEPVTVAHEGDILLTVKGTIGKIAILNISKAHIARQIMAISTFGSKLRTGYIVLFLKWYVDELKSKAKSMIPGVTKEDVSNGIFPLPPLAEQKRIVAKVEECMHAIKTIEDSSKEYEKLENQLDKKVLDLAIRGKLVPQDSQDEPASVLLEKIKEEKAQLIKEKKIKKSKPLPEITEEKPFDIPESWEWVRLGEVSAINTGNTPSKKYKEYYGGDLPFVKPADINNNHINYDTDEKLTDKGKEKGRIASPNDILITCIGNLGRNYFLDKDVAFNQQINAVTPINIEKIWLHYTLLSSFFIQQMYNNASATTVSILNKTKLERLLVPLPPLAEQKRIVTKIKGIEIYLKN